MSADIVILDNFAEFKRMLYSDSFKLIESEFKKEREKYLAKLLNNSTPDEEVIKIKAVINENTIKNLVTKPNYWSIIRLCKYEDINKLLIIKQDNNIINYDFTKIDKETYKLKNYIVKKKII